MRNLRRESIERLRRAEKDKEISQDQYTRASEQTQKITDNFIEKVDRIGQDKEAEVMEV